MSGLEPMPRPFPLYQLSQSGGQKDPLPPTKIEIFKKFVSL